MGKYSRSLPLRMRNDQTHRPTVPTPVDWRELSATAASRMLSTDPSARWMALLAAFEATIYQSAELGAPLAQTHMNLRLMRILQSMTNGDFSAPELPIAKPKPNRPSLHEARAEAFAYIVALVEGVRLLEDCTRLVAASRVAWAIDDFLADQGFHIKLEDQLPKSSSAAAPPDPTAFAHGEKRQHPAATRLADWADKRRIPGGSSAKRAFERVMVRIQSCPNQTELAETLRTLHCMARECLVASTAKAP